MSASLLWMISVALSTDIGIGAIGYAIGRFRHKRELTKLQNQLSDTYKLRNATLKGQEEIINMLSQAEDNDSLALGLNENLERILTLKDDQGSSI